MIKLCESALGWPAVYYVHATFGIFIFTVWVLFYRDEPEIHKNVSGEFKTRVFQFILPIYLFVIKRFLSIGICVEKIIFDTLLKHYIFKKLCSSGIELEKIRREKSEGYISCEKYVPYWVTIFYSLQVLKHRELIPCMS